MGLPNVILDPAQVAPAGRQEISLSGDGLKVFYEGIDWGTQEVKQFMAEGVFGSRPIDHTWPTRIIKLPLVVTASGGTTFDENRVRLEAWVALVNQESSGWIKRVLPSGKFYYADITGAKLHLSSDWLTENRDLDRGATLELEALPDFYGDEIVGAAVEGTGDLSTTMQVKGELPARVENFTIEDLSGSNQLGLMWLFRRRHYSEASTAEWAYNAEALGLLDLAEKVELAGSYGTKVVKHPKLSTGWTPVLSTNKAGSTFLTHAGLYSVWARVYSTSAVLPWLRLVYGVGDIVAPQENRQVRVPGSEAYFLVNLGQINVQAIPFGAQRWEGVIQARGLAGGENVYVDRVWFLCGDEGSGVLKAASTSITPVADTYLWRDEFNQTAGAATGKTAAVGGVYAAVLNSDASPDFEVDATTHRLKRTSTSDSGTIGAFGWVGRGIGAPVEAENLLFRESFVIDAAGAIFPASLRIGQIVSYVSNTNFVMVHLFVDPAGSGTSSLIISKPDGTTLAQSGALWGLPTFGVMEGTLTTVVRGTTINVYLGIKAESPSLVLSAENTLVGVKGKCFLYDANPTTTAVTRWFDKVGLWTPAFDAVAYGSRNARLSWKGLTRQSSDGAAYGPVSYPGSDLPRIPVSGQEETPVEIAVKPSRGQFGEVADSGKDKLKIQMGYRPCYASVPGS